MIWLTWRQHRKQALFAVIGLVVTAALILPTGLAMNDRYVDSGLAECLRTMPDTEFAAFDDAGVRRCGTLAEAFLMEFRSLAPLAFLFVFLPLLVGLFFGAPLVSREVEHGTHRFVWTQGVSRTRWALVKIGLVGGGALAVAVAYAALVTWWLRPMSLATGDRFSYLVFDLQGAVPIAYTVFATALGVFAGTVTRRVLPAMAVTVAGFIGVRVAVTMARPSFLPQHHRRYAITSGKEPNELLGDWVLSRGVYRADGTLIAANNQTLCTSPQPSAGGSAPPDPCVEQYGAGAYNMEIYQPADRFWLFQCIETGVFVALAALLLVFAIHRIRRRIT